MVKIILEGKTEEELRNQFNIEIENLISDGEIEGRL